MIDTILTLRVSRRAIGAAALKSGELTLLDGRHLNSRQDRTVPAAVRYLKKLLDLTKPARVVLDAPGADHPATITAQVVQAATDLFQQRGLPVLRVSRLDILAAFGVTHIVDRREARELARILWPDLEMVNGTVKSHVADAAAAAAYTECRLAIGPPLP